MTVSVGFMGKQTSKIPQIIPLLSASTCTFLPRYVGNNVPYPSCLTQRKAMRVDGHKREASNTSQDNHSSWQGLINSFGQRESTYAFSLMFKERNTKNDSNQWPQPNMKTTVEIMALSPLETIHSKSHCQASSLTLKSLHNLSERLDSTDLTHSKG